MIARCVRDTYLHATFFQNGNNVVLDVFEKHTNEMFLCYPSLKTL